ncbi:MAG: hypothetical protein LBL76_02775 [Treponema sp.]|nr:hypothetical protein [Treponema sp.]
MSRAYDTAADARNAARENAFAQILQYYGQYIRAASIEKSSLAVSSDEVLTHYIEVEEEITRFAETVVSQVGADRYFTEVYLNAANREEYIVYVLCQIGRVRAERDIEDFAQTISERYGNVIRTQNTLTGALNACTRARENLQQNIAANIASNLGAYIHILELSAFRDSDREDVQQLVSRAISNAIQVRLPSFEVLEWYIERGTENGKPWYTAYVLVRFPRQDIIRMIQEIRPAPIVQEILRTLVLRVPPADMGTLLLANMLEACTATIQDLQTGL